MRRYGEKVLTDERILGRGDFVEQIIKEADKRIKYQYTESQRKRKVEDLISSECKKANIEIKELKSGSRRRTVSALRRQVAIKLFKELGLPFAEIARNTGVSTSAISKMINYSSKSTTSP